MDFNEEFFIQLGKSAGVTNICKQVAEKVAATAQATAPRDTGKYADGIKVRVVSRSRRNAVLVVGTDWKTMLIESKTGNLARALQSVKKSG